MSDCETTTNVSREILERAEQERIQMAEAESRRFLCADCERLEVDLALNAKMLARQCDLARGAETERDAVQSENERLRQELAMVRETGIEATREIMSELREVAEILGGPGNTKPAIDLAKEAEVENERLRAKIERLTWKAQPLPLLKNTMICRHCEIVVSRIQLESAKFDTRAFHKPGCLAAEE